MAIIDNFLTESGLLVKRGELDSYGFPTGEQHNSRELLRLKAESFTAAGSQKKVIRCEYLICADTVVEVGDLYNGAPIVELTPLKGAGYFYRIATEA